MATVYRALDPNFNREVAIKVLPREMIHNTQLRARFKQELKMVSTLEHSAIVPVYDSGEQDGQPYFVMRYMPGGTLTEWLKNGPLSLKETAVIIERIALGLAYAHKRGVIHRDIKPDNILFDDNNTPYLSDFGVAKLAESVSSITTSGVIGTPAYASPEQAFGENSKIDHRTDIYSLGVVTYQMLTGQQPYRADLALSMLAKHIHDPVPNIIEVNPNLPPILDTIIKTALAKNREDRYPSVLEFSRALSVAAFGEERTMPAELALERKQAVLSERRRIGWWIAGTALLALLAAGYFSAPLLKPSPTPTPSPAPTSIPVIIVSATFSATPVPPTATPSNTPTPTATPTPMGGAVGSYSSRGIELSSAIWMAAFPSHSSAAASKSRACNGSRVDG